MGLQMWLDAEFVGWLDDRAVFRLLPPHKWFEKTFDISGLRLRFGGYADLRFRGQEYPAFPASFGKAGDYLDVAGLQDGEYLVMSEPSPLPASLLDEVLS